MQKTYKHFVDSTDIFTEMFLVSAKCFNIKNTSINNIEGLKEHRQLGCIQCQLNNIQRNIKKCIKTYKYFVTKTEEITMLFLVLAECFNCENQSNSNTEGLKEH